MNDPGFWTAVWTLVSSPFVVAVIAIFIGAIVTVAVVDRWDRK